MGQATPFPKWEQAPLEVRQAWHDLNNTQQRLIALHELAEALVAEAAQLLADLQEPSGSRH